MRTLMDGKPVEHDWPLAPPRFHARWDHVPVGPFRVQVWHDSAHPSRVKAEVHNDFHFAMDRTSVYYMPAEDGYTTVVLDESFQVIFGWCAAADVLADTFGQTGWYGVRAAFEWLEQSGRFDMLDLAVWEGRAMESATGVVL